MAELTVSRARLQGSVPVPPSKSIQHRAIICASFAAGVSHISPVALSEDIKATMNGMRALGAKAELKDGVLTVEGIGGKSPLRESGEVPTVDCCESGSTLRFLIPIFLTMGNGAAFKGIARLGQRPLTPYQDICRAQGIVYENRTSEETGMDIRTAGHLPAGHYTLPGNVSSQFVTGLLLALSMADGDSTIELTGDVQSLGYIHLTIDAMKIFAGQVERISDSLYRVPGNQHYQAVDYQVEGDYSQAAVFLCAGALGQDVRVQGLNPDSRQGDRAVIDILRGMGAKTDIAPDGSIAMKCEGRPKGSVIDVSQCPDIAPMLALVCALSEGESRIVNAGRLRMKECDRLSATVTEINRLGGCVREEGDEMVLQGVEELQGGVKAKCWNDHRMAMMLSIAALHCKDPIVLDDGGCVKKSYPDYFEHYRMLGGRTDG